MTNSPVQREPVMAMPTWPLLAWLAGSLAVVAGLWSLAIAIGPWGRPEFVSGMVGIAVTGVIGIVGTLIITPWKPRAMGDWMTMWLGGTVFRLLVTPVVLFLLYSAASSALAVKPLVLSVALTYLVMVMTEAGTLASHVRRSLPSP
ncbi:MAG: hypothetical protein SGJ09_11460 [Phycisphaerae bacterium]|nr:hypothetical protein [Phycisphaerae bacterium]